MPMIAMQRPGYLGAPSHGITNHPRNSASSTVTMNSKSSAPSPPFRETSPSNLQFNRLQPSEQEHTQENRLEFAGFVVREAILDEEYWTAAWLRAETHWENQTNDRYVGSYKRKFAEQEFNALKRRCNKKFKESCTCILTINKEFEGSECIMKEMYVKLNVVGTLDLSIRYLINGQTFPGERIKASPVCSSINKSGQHNYGYMADLCVAKSARRQSIGSNMLNFAIQSARSKGVKDVYVHVHRNNKPAQQLYRKMGFQVVEMANRQLVKEETYLLHLRT